MGYVSNQRNGNSVSRRRVPGSSARRRRRNGELIRRSISLLARRFHENVYDQIVAVTNYARRTRFLAEMTAVLPVVDLEAESPEERYLAPNNICRDRRFAKGEARQIVRQKIENCPNDQLDEFNGMNYHRKARIIDQFFKEY